MVAAGIEGAVTHRQGIMAAAGLAALAAAGSAAVAQQPPGPTAQAAAAEPYGPGCKVTRRAAMPLIFNQGRWSTPVEIDGVALPMMIDTGSQRAALSPAAAARIGLRPNAQANFSAQGVGGRTLNTHPFVARSIRFGPAVWAQYNLQPVELGRSAEEAGADAPVGLIGADMLSGYDVELDFPGRALTLYTVAGCTGAFAPWQTRFDTFASEDAPADLFAIPVMLNGRKVRGLLDTGSNTSSLSLQAAGQAGVGRDALAKDPIGAYTGARGVPVASHLHRFDSLTFGAFSYRNVPVSVQDANFGFADMLLGMDFLAPRRIWLSYRTRQVFIQVPRIVRAAPLPAPATKPPPRPPQRIPGRPPPF
jgi:predicted aspartyl protease